MKLTTIKIGSYLARRDPKVRLRAINSLRSVPARLCWNGAQALELIPTQRVVERPELVGSAEIPQ